MKRVAFFVKDEKLSGYPSELLIDKKLIKSSNIINECVNNNVEILIGTYLPSNLIELLRKRGVVFFKATSFDELEGVNLDIKLPNFSRIKRGWGCGFGFKV